MIGAAGTSVAHEPPPSQKSHRSILLWITAAIFAAQALFIALAPFERLGLYVNDDAYYFVMVARNWIEHGFPSLDGLTPTNGFQPLWQVLQLPLAVFGSRLVHLRLALLLGALLFQLGLLGAGTALRRLLGWQTALAFVLLLEANPLVSWGFALNGMESSLQIALVGAVLVLLTSPRPGSRGRAWLLGLAVGLCGVTRLDGLALVPCVAAFLLWRDRSARAVVPIAVLGFLPALAFIVSSQLWLGTPLPVSGQVKLVLNQRLLEQDGGGLTVRTATGAANLARAGYWVSSRVAGGVVSFVGRGTGAGDRAVGAAAGVVGLLAAVAGLVSLVRRRPAATLAPIAVVAAAAAIRLLFFAAAYPFTFHLYDWYFADALLLIAVCISPVLAVILRRRVAALAAAAVVVLNAGFFAADTANLGHFKPTLDAVGYVRGRPELSTARVASWDAGLVAFALENPVTNLDGLVNSPAFLKQVIEHHRPIAAYLREHGIAVVVNLVPGPTGTLATQGFRGLTPKDAELAYLSPVYSAPFGETRRTAVFRLH